MGAPTGPIGWADDGLTSLIPGSIAQDLIGHPFNCPDRRW
jgi:hypothetical protein